MGTIKRESKATQVNPTQLYTEVKVFSSLSICRPSPQFILLPFFFSLAFSSSSFSLKLTRSEKWDLIPELSGGRLMPINLPNSTGVEGAAATAAKGNLTRNLPRQSSQKDVRFKCVKMFDFRMKSKDGGEEWCQGRRVWSTLRRETHAHQDPQQQQQNWSRK